MGFDRSGLRAAIAAHGPVMRVVIAEVKGSSPRETGAAMLVWPQGQSGTIGGGALEFAAARAARAGHTGLSRHALGPDLGQCCGGAVTLLTERFGAQDAFGPEARTVFARATNGETMPLSVRRLLSRARDRGDRPQAQLIDGWMIEPVAPPRLPVWIWGAGHVGRALANVLAPLPDFALTWVDTGPERFPQSVPGNIAVVPAARPEALVPHAPEGAAHVILTYSHALDLELCHAILDHGFAFAGLIGSATKWARFRTRLAGLGHDGPDIAKITCPIGKPALGKHPQAIAVGVASELLAFGTAAEQNVKARAIR